MSELFNSLTNKQGLVSFGGVASTDYGMVVSEAASFDSPTRKQTIYTVPGRNGSIIKQEKAWNDVTRQYRIWIDEQTEFDSGGDIVSGTLAERVRNLMAWLNSQDGYQRLEDNFDPDVYRLAYYSGGNELANKLTLVGEGTLTFTCKPQRFLKSGETAVEVTNGDVLKNPTLFDAKPLIHIEGTGNITIGTGGKTLTITGLADYINIDCERMDSYRLPAENKNSMVSGQFIDLVPGNNTIAITGTVTKVTIKSNYFSI